MAGGADPNTKQNEFMSFVMAPNYFMNVRCMGSQQSNMQASLQPQNQLGARFALNQSNL